MSSCTKGRHTAEHLNHLLYLRQGGMLGARAIVACRWIKDIEAYTPDSVVDYPIIADPNRDVATL